MAKTKARKVTDPAVDREKITDWKSFQFVMNNLNDEELAALEQAPFDSERNSEFLEKLIDNGFDVKFGWDTYSKAYQITATGSWRGFQNAGICVSARSPEVFDAFHILWFKIEFIAGWDLTQFVGQSTGKRNRG
jgi:hypothetical protein